MTGVDSAVCQSWSAPVSDTSDSFLWRYEARASLFGSVEIPRGFIVMPEILRGQTSVINGDGVIRVEPDGGVEVPHCLVVLTLAGQGNAAIVERVGIIRLDADRLVEVLDGAVVIAPVGPGTAAVKEGAREIFRRLAAGPDDRGAGTDETVGIVVAAPCPLLFEALRRHSARKHAGQDSRQQYRSHVHPRRGRRWLGRSAMRVNDIFLGGISR
jgi:hypothetical protein